MSQKSQLYGSFLRVVLRRPDLLGEAARFAAATAPSGWMRRFPFLPLPDPAYRDWRLATAYGTPTAKVDPKEMQEFLIWRRELRKHRGS